MNIILSAVAIMLVMIAASVSLCVSSGASDQNILPKDRCVFIDHHVHKDGVALEGTGIGLMIDFPTYGFDRDNRKLTGMINFNVNDSLVVVYGDGQSLSGAMGGGAATMLYGVYSLPYDGYRLTIASVDGNGTATIFYKNRTIVLQPGQNWTSVTSEIITTDSYAGNSTRINATTTDVIVNYGLLDKKDVVKN